MAVKNNLVPLSADSPTSTNANTQGGVGATGNKNTTTQNGGKSANANTQGGVGATGNKNTTTQNGGKSAKATNNPSTQPAAMTPTGINDVSATATNSVNNKKVTAVALNDDNAVSLNNPTGVTSPSKVAPQTKTDVSVTPAKGGKSGVGNDALKSNNPDYHYADDNTGNGTGSTPTTAEIESQHDELIKQLSEAFQQLDASKYGDRPDYIEMDPSMAKAYEYGKAAPEYKVGQGPTDVSDLLNAADKNTDAYANKANDIINSLANMTDEQLNAYAAKTGKTIEQTKADIQNILDSMQALSEVGVGRLDHVNTDERERLLAQLSDAQRQQSENKINYTVNQGINELQRAQEDAAEEFQKQRNQINADERRAMDNQALYAAARGDRGGIAQSQFNSVQNTAAVNRQTVNSAQTKLATDTARQIADLRAQGEFQKADELLQINQKYLSELMDLKQWADEANLSIDQFNIELDKWEQERNQDIAMALGEMKMNATQYTTNLDLSNQKDLLNNALDAARTTAGYQLETAGNVASMRDTNINRGISTRQFADTFNESQRNTDNSALRSIFESDRNFAANQDQFTKQLVEADRYNKNSFNQSAFETDRNFNFGVDKYNTELQMQQESDMMSRAASAASQMISAGITPTKEQLAAIGWTENQYKAWQELQAKAKSGGGGGNNYYADMQQLVVEGVPMEKIEAWVKRMKDGEKMTESQAKECDDFIERLHGYKYEGTNDEL